MICRLCNEELNFRYINFKGSETVKFETGDELYYYFDCVKCYNTYTQAPALFEETITQALKTMIAEDKSNE
jgi:hypothetical protein